MGALTPRPARLAQSIGSAPSIVLASRQADLGGLILHSPLLSGMRVLRPDLQRQYWCDPFTNISKMGSVTAR